MAQREILDEALEEYIKTLCPEMTDKLCRYIRKYDRNCICVSLLKKLKDRAGQERIDKSG